MWDATSAGVEEKFQIPDELWERMGKIIPEPQPSPRGGRPRQDNRKMMTAIFYILRTGCQWNALPRSLGASSTVHDRFQQWERAGVFVAFWQAGLTEYDEQVGIDWEWQSMDGAMTKAPLGGPATGPNPTDRAKSGTKRSLLTDGHGIPLGLATAGAIGTTRNWPKELLNPSLSTGQSQQAIILKTCVLTKDMTIRILTNCSRLMDTRHTSKHGAKR